MILSLNIFVNMYSKKPKNSLYIKVRLPNQIQEIVVGSNLTKWILKEISLRNYSSHIIFIDKNFSDIHKKWLSQIKDILLPIDIIFIESNEKNKSLDFLNFALNKCFKTGMNRKSCIIAIGGGIVGDISGFFASVYMRGVDFIFIPTTLMAQADTIINKVAISHRVSKNIIGSFYSPVMTICDTTFLKTLSKYEISLGLSEVIKHAFIKSSIFVKYLENILRTNLFGWKKYPWKKIIYESIYIKSKIVEKDPFDKYGIHKGLSYGHTFSNAFESLSNFKFRHGESVSLGMYVSALISNELGILSKNDFDRQKELLQKIGLPIKLNSCFRNDSIIDFMLKDKIYTGHGLTIVILNKVGKYIVYKDTPKELILSALSAI